jgi:hypothetical protein
MMHQIDHRHGTFEGQPELEIRKGLCRELMEAERARPDFVILPRYWVSENNCIQSAGHWTNGHRWFIAFRRITRAVDRRTATFCILPWSGAGDSIFFVSVQFRDKTPAFLANVNSITFDFVVRQKMPGINLSFYIVQQLPVLPPERYTSDLLAFIVPRILELTYTAWDLKAFADDVWREADKTLRAAIVQGWEANVAATGGHVGTGPPAWTPSPAPWTVSQDRLPLPGGGSQGGSGFPHPPFKWDEERRAHLRAELDALYGHLYGLTREELDYILDTFPIVRRKDEARYGDFRTKRLVLENYARLGL